MTLKELETSILLRLQLVVHNGSTLVSVREEVCLIELGIKYSGSIFFYYIKNFLY